MAKKILGFVGLGLLVIVTGLFIYGQATGKPLFGFLRSTATNATASTVFPSYYRFEPVSFTLSNNTTSPLPLGTTNPWKIVDGNGNLVWQPPTQSTTSFLGSKQWTWDQRGLNLSYVAPGNYKVVFDSFGTSAPIVINSTPGSTGMFTFSFAGSTDKLTTFISNTRVIRDAIDNYYKKNTKHIPMGALLDDRPGKSPYDSQWSWQLDPSTIRMLSVNCGSITPSQVESNLAYYFPSHPGGCFSSAQVASLDSPQTLTDQELTQQMEQVASDVAAMTQIALSSGYNVSREGNLNTGAVLLTSVINPVTGKIIAEFREVAETATVSGNNSNPPKDQECIFDNTGARVLVDKYGQVSGIIGQDVYLNLSGASGNLAASCQGAEPYFNNVSGIPHITNSPNSGTAEVKVIFDPKLPSGEAAETQFDQFTLDFRKITVIKVNPAVFNNSTPDRNIETCEHELAHVLGAGHNDPADPGSIEYTLLGNLMTIGGMTTPQKLSPDLIALIKGLQSCTNNADKSNSSCYVKDCKDPLAPSTAQGATSTSSGGGGSPPDFSSSYPNTPPWCDLNISDWLCTVPISPEVPRYCTRTTVETCAGGGGSTYQTTCYLNFDGWICQNDQWTYY